jgi:hypothetical protein
MFCLGRSTSPKGHDRIKLKGRRSHSARLSCPPSSPSDQKYSQACRIVAGPIEADRGYQKRVWLYSFTGQRISMRGRLFQRGVPDLRP